MVLAEKLNHHMVIFFSYNRVKWTDLDLCDACRNFRFNTVSLIKIKPSSSFILMMTDLKRFDFNQTEIL